MEAGEWIAFAGIVLAMAGPMIGAVWAHLGRQIREASERADAAHARLEKAVLTHSQFREEVATTYVRRDNMRERFAEVMQPVHDDMRRQKTQLDRIERFQLRLMERMHIPAVAPEEPD